MNNSFAAIDDNVYDVSVNLEKSNQDLIQKMKVNPHATLITEIKFASPSLGKIRTISDPVSIAKSMIAGGSSALSILTQPYLFNGSPEYFIQVRQAVDVPLLMKDIMVDKIQIDAAQKIGADYMLLIQSLFDQEYLKDIDEFIDYGHKKGLNILLEVHTVDEFKNALDTDADLIGINNRNLDTLKIDLNATSKILSNFDKSRPIISESGIESPQDIINLRKAGASGFLIGSSIMNTDNIEENVKELVNAY